MSSLKFAKHAIYIGLAVAFCTFCIPRPAAADSADIVSLSFLGAASCAAGACTSTSVTGNFSFDPDTDSIVGPWSFSTPLGTMSSADVSGIPIVATQPSQNESEFGGGPNFPSGFNFLDFLDGNLALQLAFDCTNGYDGTLVTPESVGLPGTDYTALGGNLLTGDEFILTSGSASPVATPEPSTLTLLCFGIIGLVFLRRHFSDRARPRCAS